MSASHFECRGCGNDEFRITTRQMLGEDGDYIDLIICTECEAEYYEAPRPSKLRDD